MRTSHLRYLAGVAVCALLLTACVETTVETFRQSADRKVDSAYFKSGVDFSKYRALQPFPLEIYFYDDQEPPAPEDLAKIREIFREAFLAAIGPDYPLVERPGPDVLGVRASLVDLELSTGHGELPLSGRAAKLVADGQLTFLMELTDSQTKEVLARAGDREKSVAEVGTGDPERDWSRTRTAAEHWAQLFREFLDDNLGR
jgi:hypothetical protein